MTVDEGNALDIVMLVGEEVDVIVGAVGVVALAVVLAVVLVVVLVVVVVAGDVVAAAAGGLVGFEIVVLLAMNTDVTVVGREGNRLGV